jgi:hypothetical protein
VLKTLYRIEVNTPDGWATLQGNYESEEFAIRDAQRDLREARVVSFTRAETVWWSGKKTEKTDFLKGYRPGICSYCGHPENSGACQRGHP